MKAIIVTDNKKLVWNEVPAPVRKEGEIIIEIRAAGVNRADLMQRAGSYPPPPDWPQWMGLEAAGVVAETAADSRWKVGDKVCALLGGGGYAERVAVPEGMVLPVPKGLTFVEAAAIPEAIATAYLNLWIEGGMKTGDTVFIQAGASGLGMVAIQLARLLGVKVVTTVGSEEKAAFVRGLGADVVINRKKDNIADVLAKHPADIALDCVAGSELGPCLKTMAGGGRWIVIATLGGTVSEIDMRDFFKRGIRLIGSTLRSRTSEMKSRILADLERQVWNQFSSGAIKSVIHKTLPITNAEEAHEILQNRENMGKVVLEVV